MALVSLASWLGGGPDLSGVGAAVTIQAGDGNSTIIVASSNAEVSVPLEESGGVVDGNSPSIPNLNSQLDPHRKMRILSTRTPERKESSPDVPKQPRNATLASAGASVELNVIGSAAKSLSALSLIDGQELTSLKFPPHLLRRTEGFGIEFRLGGYAWDLDYLEFYRPSAKAPGSHPKEIEITGHSVVSDSWLEPKSIILTEDIGWSQPIALPFPDPVDRFRIVVRSHRGDYSAVVLGDVKAIGVPISVSR